MQFHQQSLLWGFSANIEAVTFPLFLFYHSQIFVWSCCVKICDISPIFLSQFILPQSVCHATPVPGFTAAANLLISLIPYRSLLVSHIRLRFLAFMYCPALLMIHPQFIYGFAAFSAFLVLPLSFILRFLVSVHSHVWNLHKLTQCNSVGDRVCKNTI